MTISRYENLIKTATWWAVVGGRELPLCNGHGHPEVLSPEGEEIQIPSGTSFYFVLTWRSQLSQLVW